MCILCILIPVLIGLISALLGYLLGRILGKKKCANCDELSAKLTACEADLDACKVNSAKLQLAIDDLNKPQAGSKKNFVANAPVVETAPSSFDAKLATDVFGKKIKQDDLKIVEGIGPKIEELFHAAGIKTWKALAETSVEKCREILKGGGERFQMHNPETWPKQSEFADQGKWKELKDWQDSLDGGKK